MSTTTKEPVKDKGAKSSVLGFECPDELRDKVDEFAAQMDSTRSQVLRRAVRLGLLVLCAKERK